MAAAAAGREVPLPQTRASAPSPQVPDAAASSPAMAAVLPAIPTPSVSRMKTLATRTASAGISRNRVVTTWSAKAPMASIFLPPDDAALKELIGERGALYLISRDARGARRVARAVWQSWPAGGAARPPNIGTGNSRAAPDGAGQTARRCGPDDARRGAEGVHASAGSSDSTDPRLPTRDETGRSSNRPTGSARSTGVARRAKPQRHLRQIGRASCRERV